jgi:ATP-dependent Lon protease
MADRDKATTPVDEQDVLTDTLVEEVIEQIEAEGEKPAPKARGRKAKPVAASDAEGEQPAPKKRAPRRKKAAKQSLALPVVITNETILLPHMSIPYPIEDDETARAIDRAMRMNPRMVLLLTERRVDRRTGEESPIVEPERDLIDMMTDLIAEQVADDEFGFTDAPDEKTSQQEDWENAVEDDQAQYELCQVGVIAEVGQYISRPGGQDHVILQGITRGVAEELIQDQPFVAAKVRREDDVVSDPAQTEAAMAAVLEQIESYISMLPNVPEEVLTMVRSVDEPGWLADLIAFSPEFSSNQRQTLLETLDPIERLRQLSIMIQKRLNVLNLRHEIQSEAQAGMDKQQREYFLREQLRAIQKELGEGSSEEALANEIREKIETCGMPDEVKAKALVQVERLEQQHPFSPEIGVIRTYLEWLTELPWAAETEDRLDLEEAARILDEDHYGLDKVKERIVEFIAVRKLAGDKLRAPILCFVGPPGVGKTSLG